MAGQVIPPVNDRRYDLDEKEYIYNKSRRTTYDLAEAMEKERGAELRALRDNWTWKDDDVVVHAFPRSGSHLTWIMCRYIVQGNTDLLTDAMEDSHYCILGLKDVQKGRRVLGTHYKPADYLKGFWSKNGKRKHIAVVRNGKDVAVSYHIVLKNLLTVFPDPGNFDEYLTDFCYKQNPHGNWFINVRAWEEYMDRHPEIPIMLLYFEDMVMNLANTVRKIAHFLDCPLSEDMIQEIAAKCEFHEIKKQTLSDTFTQGFKDTAQTTENLFYRKGKIGDWKNHFTVKQSEMFDSAYTEIMKGSKLRFQFERNGI